MLTAPADKSDELVSMNAHNIPRRDRRRFRIWCIEHGITMQDALRDFVQRTANGENLLGISHAGADTLEIDKTFETKLREEGQK